MAKKTDLKTKSDQLFEKILGYSATGKDGSIDIDLLKIQVDIVKYMNKLEEESLNIKPILPEVEDLNTTKESSENLEQIAQRASEDLRKQKLG